MKTNLLMEPLWPAGRPAEVDLLPAELRDLLDGGWMRGPVNSLLLRSAFGSGWSSSWNAEDVALHEYEVNDVWIPPDNIPRARDVFLPAMVGRARDFTFHAMRLAEDVQGVDRLVAIISVGIDSDYLTHGTTVKFFTRRGRHLSFYDDLDRYRTEAIALVEKGGILSECKGSSVFMSQEPR
ncbi:hypothetical protein [Parafrankia elaeagni]|uniref:hypothetical protein n=1 Tax=Parafrankia elaeagni TaxID=222534 RepID=UPI0012B635E3|nr:hypothetical protein [Parafrankia elaeagni]